MKKLLTGIVAGVATITLGASCVLAATQFNEDDLAKVNNFPICYPNCELNYVDNNENGVCDNAEEEICPTVQNVEEPVSEEPTENQQEYVVNDVDNNQSENYDSVQNEVAPVTQDVEPQNTPQTYYCPDCGGDYIDNNGNGICDNIEQGICPPAQNTTGNGYYGHHGSHHNGYYQTNNNTQQNNNYNYGHHGGHCRR